MRLKELERQKSEYSDLLHLSLLTQKYFYCFQFELPRAQPRWFSLHPGRAEKGWPVTCLILLPNIPALFTTSLTVTETDGHKNGSTRVFTTFNRRFLTSRTRNRTKNCHVSIFIPFHVDRPGDVSSLRSPLSCLLT